MAQDREGTDMLEQLGDELKLQAWLAAREIAKPSLNDTSTRTEVDALARLRDELRLQLHLGKLEAKDEFHRLEERWRGLMAAAVESASDAAGRVRGLLGEIRDGYRALRGGAQEEPDPV
jgi:hypothetical protein